MSKHQFTDIRVAIEPDNPSIQRLEFKCIKCGNCKTVCTDYIGVCGTYDLKATGDKPICINCGQCANVCPADSITEKIEAYQVMAEIRDEDKIVIFSTSPSVRIALGEEFGMPDGSFVEGKMVALLRRLGADYVLDTNFAADMTIVEEASELLQRITEGNKPLPQFTSCCPAWVKFAETYYPEMLPHISSAKSPIGMQGPTIKTYFAKKMGIDPRKIVNVAVTPCTAKKFEIRRGEMNAAGRYLGIEDMRDMDYVITTRELAMLAKDEGIDFTALEDSAYDDLMGQALFSATPAVLWKRQSVLLTATQPARTHRRLCTICSLCAVWTASARRKLILKELKLKWLLFTALPTPANLLKKLKQAKQSTTLWKLWPARAAASAAADSPKTRNIKAMLCVRRALKGFTSATAA